MRQPQVSVCSHVRSDAALRNTDPTSDYSLTGCLSPQTANLDVEDREVRLPIHLFYKPNNHSQRNRLTNNGSERYIGVAITM